MEKVTKLLINKYQKLIEDLSIGYPLDNKSLKEILFLIHVLHYVKYERASDNESLNILAYYE